MVLNCSGYLMNCDEAMFGVQKASLNMFWKYSPSSTNLPSDWLRSKSFPVDEQERKIQWMTVLILHSLRRKSTFLLTCGKRSLVSDTQNDIVVSWITLWITLWGMIKVYWLDFNLQFGSWCLLRFFITVFMQWRTMARLFTSLLYATRRYRLDPKATTVDERHWLGEGGRLCLDWRNPSPSQRLCVESWPTQQRAEHGALPEYQHPRLQA